MTTETKIDFTKPVRTRDGREVRIFTTEAQIKGRPVIGEMYYINGSRILATWDKDGLFKSETICRDRDLDLVNYEPEQFVYVNVYEYENLYDGLYISSYSHTRECADDLNRNRKRVGCLKIKLERRFDE